MDLLRSVLGEQSLDSIVEDEENLFLKGLDSVKTVDFVQQLRSALLAYKPHLDLKWLSLDWMYVTCTLREMCSGILDFLNDELLPQQKDRTVLIQDTLDRYLGKVLQLDADGYLPDEHMVLRNGGFSIAVTGTTGFLGTHIVERLLGSPAVTCIFCLNRDSKASSKWSASHEHLHPKLKFLTADLTKPGLAVSDLDRHNLITDLDLIIHNAWPVNFDLPLTAFEPSFDSLLDLIQMCRRAARRPKIPFISSITSASPYAAPGSDQNAIPEGLVSDPHAPLPMGYPESKYVAEHIVSAASKHDFAATILRVGFVCPSMTRAEATKGSPDIMTNLLQSCKTMKAIPYDFPPVDRVTVDQVYSVVEELAQHILQESSAKETQIFNLTNPHPLPWVELLPELQAWIKHAETVPTTK